MQTVVYGGRELAASFRLVRSNTIRIAEDIPEEQYGFQATPETRTVAQLLAHIAFGPFVQTHIQGSHIDDLRHVDFADLVRQRVTREAGARSKADLLVLLRTEGDRFASYLEGLSDAFLAERVAMMPGAQPASKSRLELLLSPKEHEMHHRGQLMLVQRMLGRVPHLTRERLERLARSDASHGQTRP